MENNEIITMNLIQDIYNTPWQFSLHQFMFLTKKLKDKNKKINFKFRSTVDMSISPSDIKSIKHHENTNEIFINGVSLLGVQGALPIYYINTAMDRKRKKDHALEEFLDIFNNKVIQNTYLIKKKSSFCFTNTKLNNTTIGKISNAIGVGVLNNQNKVTRDISTAFPILYWSQRTPQNLQYLLEAFLKNAKVSYKQFIGKWIKIAKNDMTILKSDCSKASLGRKFLGKTFWNGNHGIKLNITTRSKTLYSKILPGGEMRKDLEILIKSYIPFHLHFSIDLKLEYESQPKLRLGNQSILSYFSWLNKDDRGCFLQ